MHDVITTVCRSSYSITLQRQQSKNAVNALAGKTVKQISLGKGRLSSS